MRIQFSSSTNIKFLEILFVLWLILNAKNIILIIFPLLFYSHLFSLLFESFSSACLMPWRHGQPFWIVALLDNPLVALEYLHAECWKQHLNSLSMDGPKFGQLLNAILDLAPIIFEQDLLLLLKCHPNKVKEIHNLLLKCSETMPNYFHDKMVEIHKALRREWCLYSNNRPLIHNPYPQ